MPLLLGIVLIAAVVANVAWIRLDTRGQPFMDPYVERTLTFVNGLSDGPLQTLPRRVAGLAVGPRPPLYQAATVPFVVALGRSPDSMLAVNVLGLVVLALCTYAMGAMAMSRGAGLLAAIIVLTSPPIVNLAKIARPHSVAPAAVALTIALALLVVRTRASWTAWLLGASVAIAVLVHPNTFYALPVPVALVCLYAVFKPAPTPGVGLAGSRAKSLPARILDRFVITGLVPAAAIALGMAGVWYVPMFRRVRMLVEESAEHWSAARYGFEDVAPSFWWYALTSPGALSIFFCAAFLVGCIGIVVGRSRINGVPTAVVALFVASIYTGMSLRQGSFAWMNFAVVLGPAAALTAVGIMALLARPGAPAAERDLAPAAGGSSAHRASAQRAHLVTTVVVAACLGMAVLNYLVVDWGVPRSPALWRLLGSPLGDTCASRMNVAFCPRPPVGGDWKFREVLQTVVEDPECRGRECSLVIATNWRDAFSSSQLRYHRQIYFPDAPLAIRRMDSLEPSPSWLISEYLVYIPELERGSYEGAVLSLVETLADAAGGGHFREVNRFPLPNGHTVRVVKRTRPVTAGAARALVDLLDAPAAVRDTLRARVDALPW